MLLYKIKLIVIKYLKAKIDIYNIVDKIFIVHKEFTSTRIYFENEFIS